MYKRHILQLLVCLLALIPIGTRAQQLTGYEYWFDGDLSTIVEKSLSGSKADIEISINTQHLSDGLHTLNFRVKQSDGRYSPVTSSVFFKHNVEEGNQIEYWFDDRYEDRATIDLPSSALEDLVDMTFDMQDNEKFPIGLHQLNIRMATEGKSLNSVYSAWVLKLASGEPNIIEYWVDDNNDKEHRRTVTGHKASSENSHDYVFVNPFDLSGVSPGLHRIYYRATSESGVTNSAVYMTTVTVGCGTTPTLEYWIDDDGSTLATISGHDPSSGDKGTIFGQTLDLSKVSPGAHRLNYRAVDANGIAQTAISSTPILVKSKYNINPEDAKVTQYSVSIDDEEPMVLDVLTPKHEIIIPYTADVRGLSVGSHTVKAKYWNSVNTSVSVEQKFEVSEQEEPYIVLTAEEKDGLVLLKYNGVPNDRGSHIKRVDDNGAEVLIYERCVGFYTEKEWHTDDPPASGNYSYFIQTDYADAKGDIHTVTSNVVKVSVAQPQSVLNNCGYIYGRIYKNTFSTDHIKVYFSDGAELVSRDGTFRREKIPAGTELTIEVQDTQYSSFSLSYDPITITVKKGENYVYFEGISEEDLAPNNMAHDLIFDSDLEWTGQNFQFMVKNWTKKTWEGVVRFRAISEESAKKANANNGSGTENNYYYSKPVSLRLESGHSSIVALSLEDVFPDNKKDYYVFYIESEGKWTVNTKQDPEVKPIGVNFGYNVTENPFTRLIDKSSLSKAKDIVLMEDIEAAANLILMVCTKINAFDGILGNINDYFEELQKQSEKLKDFDMKKYSDYVETALETENFEELITDEMVMLIPKSILGICGSAILKKFRENVKSDMLSEAWDKWTITDITSASKFINDYLGKAMGVVKAIKAYKDWDHMSTYDRHFYCAEAILKYTEKSNPFSEVLKVYVDVAEAFIRKALEYGEEYYGWYESQLLYENIPNEKERDKFEYNKYVDFKIMVQTNKLVYFNFGGFPFGKGTSQIKEVKVMLSNRDVDQVDVIYFQPIGVWDGVMLKQIKYDGLDPLKTEGQQGNIQAGEKLKRLWMEIKWKNGRTTKIPLLNTKYENIADIIELRE